jgi:hypothetical protein
MKYIGFNILTIVIILIIGFICSLFICPYFYFPEENEKMNYWNSHNGCYIKNDLPCKMISIGPYPDIPKTDITISSQITVKDISSSFPLSLYHCNVYGINNEQYKIIKQSDCYKLKFNNTYTFSIRPDKQGYQTQYIDSIS